MVNLIQPNISAHLLTHFLLQTFMTFPPWNTKEHLIEMSNLTTTCQGQFMAMAGCQSQFHKKHLNQTLLALETKCSYIIWNYTFLPFGYISSCLWHNVNWDWHSLLMIYSILTTVQISLPTMSALLLKEVSVWGQREVSLIDLLFQSQCKGANYGALERQSNPPDYLFSHPGHVFLGCLNFLSGWSFATGCAPPLAGDAPGEAPGEVTEARSDVLSEKNKCNLSAGVASYWDSSQGH